MEDELTSTGTKRDRKLLGTDCLLPVIALICRRSLMFVMALIVISEPILAQTQTPTNTKSGPAASRATNRPSTPVHTVTPGVVTPQQSSDQSSLNRIRSEFFRDELESVSQEACLTKMGEAESQLAAGIARSLGRPLLAPGSPPRGASDFHPMEWPVGSSPLASAFCNERLTGQQLSCGAFIAGLHPLRALWWENSGSGETPFGVSRNSWSRPGFLTSYHQLLNFCRVNSTVYTQTVRTCLLQSFNSRIAHPEFLRRFPTSNVLALVSTDFREPWLPEADECFRSSADYSILSREITTNPRQRLGISPDAGILIRTNLQYSIGATCGSPSNNAPCSVCLSNSQVNSASAMEFEYTPPNPSASAGRQTFLNQIERFAGPRAGTNGQITVNQQALKIDGIEVTNDGRNLILQIGTPEGLSKSLGLESVEQFPFSTIRCDALRLANQLLQNPTSSPEVLHGTLREMLRSSGIELTTPAPVVR